MRIWDINPGYLNNKSLLGEHSELHGVVSIVTHHKSGYSNHPEVIRWIGYGWALKQRHQLLAAEMSLRGFADSSRIFTRSHRGKWPAVYIDDPFRQLELLRSKYKDREKGRIPLPENAQQLWSHHKYSVLARDTDIYLELGRELSARRSRLEYQKLALSLTELLRLPPTEGGIRNCLEHMWGYVSEYSTSNIHIDAWSLNRLLKEIQKRAMAGKIPYLTSSTALSELSAWIPKR